MLSAESSNRARTPSGRISYARIDRKIDGVEGSRPIERDGGDRAVDPEQCRIGGRGGGMFGCRHLEPRNRTRLVGI